MSRNPDAIVVGAGPNGLSAAITLQQAGLQVLLLEAKLTVGGGLRSAELTLPGFIHDRCSAIHPLAIGSPFFNTLPLAAFGLEYVQPTFAAAHPFDNGNAATLQSSLAKTAAGLGEDQSAYYDLMQGLVRDWRSIAADVLGPLRFPQRPLPMARFGLKALQSATHFVQNHFRGTAARGLFGGMAAHSMLPFTNNISAAAGLVLMMQGHLSGWPMIKGGSQQLANALAAYFISLGGQIETDREIKSLRELPDCQAVLLDLTPKQLITIASDALSDAYRNRLQRFRYGVGVFKIDWALDAPIPFTNEDCRGAGTLHLGNTFEEMAANEQLTADGQHPEKPFVLLAQQSIFDATRAPSGKHTAWAYCHVPAGSTLDMTAAIEQQVERFAPGFRERILAKHVMNTAQLETYNPNYVGGDINGGVQDLGQLFTRPVLRLPPYSTSKKGLYLCSSSTPPGGAVHGMCGYYAARSALKDVFRIEPLPLSH